MRFVVWATVLLATIMPHAIAQPPAAPADVSATLEPIIAKHKVPGMAALVIKGNEIVAQGAAGVRRAGSPDKATTNDLWHIGSCTKSMTATMIGALIDEGKLSWTTTVGETFPELADKMDVKWKTVTLHQLMTHRAGSPHDLNAGGLWGRLVERNGTPTEQRMQLVEGVVTLPPVHEPGTRFLYSNAGFAIAGAMAEKVTGTSWEELMQARLFKPLGVTTAGFGAPGTAAAKDAPVDQPRGHRQNLTPIEPGPRSDNPPSIGPGGTVHLSLPDWAKYIAFHLDEAERVDHGFKLKPETLAKLHEPVRGNGGDYACGWGVTERPWAGSAGRDRVLTHNGSNTMWFAVVWLAPEKNMAAIVACNYGGRPGDQACDEAAAALIGAYVSNASTVNK